MSCNESLKTPSTRRLPILGPQVLFGFQFNGMFQEAFADLHLPLRLIACAGLVLVMIAIGLLIAPSMQDRIVVRGEDSVAVIEMSPESWFVVGIVPGISRAPLQKLHRWREEASTWLWPVNVGAYVD